jgi:hypothetical protein
MATLNFRNFRLANSVDVFLTGGAIIDKETEAQLRFVHFVNLMSITHAIVFPVFNHDGMCR